MKQYPIATKGDFINKNMLASCCSAPECPLMMSLKEFNNNNSN